MQSLKDVKYFSTVYLVVIYHLQENLFSFQSSFRDQRVTLYNRSWQYNM